MNTVRYNNLALLNHFNELNKLFERRWQADDDQSTVETSHWVPQVDIKEEPSQFVLLADIPGVDPKNIEIAMENGTLTIKGQRDDTCAGEQKGFTRVERRTGTFYRRFALPDTANAEAISAQGQHGVLEVIIPKREKAVARKIDVAVKSSAAQ